MFIDEDVDGDADCKKREADTNEGSPFWASTRGSLGHLASFA